MDDISLYKYRDFKNKNHLRLLTDGEIYFPSPQNFTDPNDCAVPLRVDFGSPDQIFSLYLTEYIRQHPETTDGDAEAAVKELLKLNDPYSEKERAAWAEASREISAKTLGICSLARNCNSAFMWEHYADHHRGFLVRLDWNGLVEWVIKLEERGIQVRPIPVRYVENLPVLDVFSITPGEALKQIISSKLDSFSLEEEYRLFGSGIPDTPLKLDMGIIKSVALGHDVSDKNFNLVLDIVRNYNRPVELYQAKRLEYEIGTKIVFLQISY